MQQAKSRRRGQAKLTASVITQNRVIQRRHPQFGTPMSVWAATPHISFSPTAGPRMLATITNIRTSKVSAHRYEINPPIWPP